MKMDKTAVLLLAGIVVCGVIAFGPPAMGDNSAQQTANVYNTNAVIITNQSGLAENTVTGWTFKGQVGGNAVTTPENTDLETQATGSNLPVACLNNTNNLSVAITLNAGSFSPANVVASEGYNISSSDNSKAFGSFAGMAFGIPEDPSVTIGEDAYRGLYLNITTGTYSGSATSAFTVTCEA